MDPQGKYRPFPAIKMEKRMWPERQITQVPIWCSVCLRDGNQALATPMTVDQKMIMFDLLVRCGFKEIEVGFPSASATEFKFIRRLIEEQRIPEDVIIQVLVPTREDLIKTTIESLIGAKKVIIHFYNSTSPAQRRDVFGLEKSEIVALAEQGAKWIKQYSEKLSLAGTNVSFEYSPESFSATEVDFALEVCETVIKVLKPTPDHKMIINLPTTVEVAPVNIYADQIEWFCGNVSCRNSIIVSVHPHNDRGTAVAAAEFGIMAGADRVEGTLFGNGERSGNLDIITMALNMFSQGVDPQLDFTNLDQIREVYESCTGMIVPPRHPYSGELIFTAFSGTHQDAIKKGLKAREKRLEQIKDNESVCWDVPYLLVDPNDLGRKYEEVIRVNSQSGKGGVAYLLESLCGIYLPKDMQREFGTISGQLINALGREVRSDDLKLMLWEEYIERVEPYKLEHFSSTNNEQGCECRSFIYYHGQQLILNGKGNGPIAAFMQSLQTIINVSMDDQYSEHTLGKGPEASAITYIQLIFPNGQKRWGAGVDSSTEMASIRAIISALNRA